MDPTSESTPTNDGLGDAVRRAKVIRRSLDDALGNPMFEVRKNRRRCGRLINQMIEAVHGQREPTPRKRAFTRFTRIAGTKASTEAARPREALCELPEGPPARVKERGRIKTRWL